MLPRQRNGYRYNYYNYNVVVCPLLFIDQVTQTHLISSYRGSVGTSASVCCPFIHACFYVAALTSTLSLRRSSLYRRSCNIEHFLTSRAGSKRHRRRCSNWQRSSWLQMHETLHSPQRVWLSVCYSIKWSKAEHKERKHNTMILYYNIAWRHAAITFGGSYKCS